MFIRINFIKDIHILSLLYFTAQDNDLHPAFEHNDLLGFAKNPAKINEGIYLCEIDGRIYIKDISIDKGFAILSSGRSRNVLVKLDDFKPVGKINWYCKFKI